MCVFLSAHVWVLFCCVRLEHCQSGSLCVETVSSVSLWGPISLHYSRLSCFELLPKCFLLPSKFHLLVWVSLLLSSYYLFLLGLTFSICPMPFLRPFPTNSVLRRTAEEGVAESVASRRIRGLSLSEYRSPVQQHPSSQHSLFNHLPGRFVPGS